MPRFVTDGVCAQLIVIMGRICSAHLTIQNSLSFALEFKSRKTMRRPVEQTLYSIVVGR
jgi:hypothetical protein